MKIINKEEKIKFICDEAYKVFVKVGIDEFSLNKFIAEINMSKGQFYHYFKTKEELIYQVISKKTFELVNNIKEEYENKKSFIDKLNLIFSLYLNDEEYYKDIYNVLKQIFEEEIEQGNFTKDSIHLAKSICATADGMFLQSLMVDNYNLKLELTNYFIELEKLLKKK